VKILCIRGKHVSNEKELTVRQRICGLRYLCITNTNKYYRILKGILVLNTVTPGSVLCKYDILRIYMWRQQGIVSLFAHTQ
jgi:hypothetical protein